MGPVDRGVRPQTGQRSSRESDRPHMHPHPRGQCGVGQPTVHLAAVERSSTALAPHGESKTEVPKPVGERSGKSRKCFKSEKIMEFDWPKRDSGLSVIDSLLCSHRMAVNGEGR